MSVKNRVPVKDVAKFHAISQEMSVVHWRMMREEPLFDPKAGSASLAGYKGELTPLQKKWLNLYDELQEA